MKLRLVNFRCHLDKTFDFGENGLFLISAPSGHGKSSILMAINFVLYGKGQKVVSHNQSSCSVELTFQDLFITRKKKPNKLVIKFADGTTYDDDIAQKIIDQRFGTSFDVTGYIAQNALNSFIVMGPTEKLAFLEKFSFQDINLEELRKKCKSLISQTNEDFIRCMSQTQTIEQVISELVEPKPINFPLKTKNRDLAKKNEEIKLRNSEKLIKKNTTIINKTKDELNCTKILNSYIKNKEENIDSICSKLEILKLEQTDNDFIGEEKLIEYKTLLQNLLSLEKLKILINQFENETCQLNDMKNRELSEIQQKIDTGRNVLWSDYSKEECLEYLSSYKEQLKDSRRISFLTKQIQNKGLLSEDETQSRELEIEQKKNDLNSKKELLDALKKRKITYCCPSCDTNLFFENDSLHVSIDGTMSIDETDESLIITEIRSLEKEIKAIENIIAKSNNLYSQNLKLMEQIDEIKSQYDDELEDENSLTTQLKDIEDYYQTQLTLEKNLGQLQSNLENENFSSSYSMTKNKVSKLQKDVKNLELSINVEDKDSILKENEEELRKLINDEENKQRYIQNMEEKRKSFERELSEQKRQNELKMSEHISLYTYVRSEEELFEIIKTSEEEIENNEKSKVEHQRNLLEIEKYNNYIIEKEKYDSWVTKLKDSSAKEDESKEKYTAAKILLEKIIESESIAMFNVVENINQHSQVYLEHFFPDNPIVVNLSCFKETKKSSKPQINVEISYKGNECDITSLSGGETSRVILAFTLALAEIFNVPLLMLDECTASLDNDSTNIVFETIKENFCNKTVLVVAHQCTEGSFDAIISL